MLAADFADEARVLGGNVRPSRAAAPAQPVAEAVPAEHRLGLDQDERLWPACPVLQRAIQNARSKKEMRGLGLSRRSKPSCCSRAAIWTAFCMRERNRLRKPRSRAATMRNIGGRQFEVRSGRKQFDGSGNDASDSSQQLQHSADGSPKAARGLRRCGALRIGAGVGAPAAKASPCHAQRRSE